jgi:hypothetical protein
LQGKLEKLLDSQGFLAVYWYARNCKRSENILKGELVDIVKSFPMTFYSLPVYSFVV